MKIKKFLAKDYQTALKMAKAEMGPDAIILHTEKVKKKGIFGLFSPPQVEITVAVDETIKVRTDKKRDNFAASYEPGKRESVSAGNQIKSPEERESLFRELNTMKSMMEEIRNKMYEVELVRGMPEEIQRFFRMLLENNIDKDIALNIINKVENRLPPDKLHDKMWIRDLVLDALEEYVKEIRPIEIDVCRKGTVVMLIGPTGVGKTTTIAKLAANLTFMDKKEVALITLDTYRVAAAEQLRTFAEIIGIPISVVFDQVELKEAIEKYREKDVVFIDTAGRSPYNDEQMAELKEYIEVAAPDEIILVLSVTTQSSELVNIYNRFSLFNIDKIIFTKVDEARSYGQILNTIYEIKKPIAYITNGQNVPDDIKVPDPLYLAKMLLGKDEAL
ncbi:flagellar biosynthesis protein FlhF [Thermosyntropha lipolytica DSM 11003]|uniref:Flagellar biosynthesis protein FlhF n=1 Tax=Thermosyntropha lipolytica DSM 11003 TaxID=1123382 RepID=A0A1M5KYC8_9FIRM|nr:flagellar biosynthesis protein FlhF [Thermosyntropha lipolytica]SHG57715.1 flagellar biosynthesis protein FlhF [Thermosyntropha lipolytica DSM 11003]